jgi:hypothetical protein
MLLYTNETEELEDGKSEDPMIIGEYILYRSQHQRRAADQPARDFDRTEKQNLRAEWGTTSSSINSPVYPRTKGLLLGGTVHMYQKFYYAPPLPMLLREKIRVIVKQSERKKEKGEI